MSIPHSTPEAEKAKMEQIWFETYAVPLIKCGSDINFAMLTSGKTTGCLVDIGEDQTRVTIVNEGK